MRDDYKIDGPTEKIEIEIEAPIVDKLQEMTKYTNLRVSELVNTAVKRFISQHQDFLPPKLRNS